MERPIEMREYFRLWTRDDARKGIKPLFLPTGPDSPGDLFVRVGLQYRYRSKAGPSDWLDCPIALEGYTDSPPLVGDPSMPPQTAP